MKTKVVSVSFIEKAYNTYNEAQSRAEIDFRLEQSKHDRVVAARKR
jgi:hypothetical protein